MRIESVLFDADGVLQKPAEARRSAWAKVVGHGDDLDGFLEDVFEAELSALDGRSDFAEAFSQVLSRWKCQGTFEDALDAWTMIEVDTRITDTVRDLRRNGVGCYLATNQEPHRARHMSEALGYRSLFDREFYSCHLGLMKPDGAYFRAILSEIGVRPSNLLFLDDHAVNVAAARKVGLHAAEFCLEAGPEALGRILREFGIRPT